MARGVRPIAGRMAKLIDAHRTELEGIIAGLEEREGLFAMERWVVKQDLRIWFSSHGKCFLRLAPGQARCHQLAGTAHWANREPNYTYRSPEVCLGCPAYAIDGEHEVYWVRRYLENQTAWMKAVAGGFEKDYRISEFRALQSAAVMKAIQRRATSGRDRDKICKGQLNIPHCARSSRSLWGRCRDWWTGARKIPTWLVRLDAGRSRSTRALWRRRAGRSVYLQFAHEPLCVPASTGCHP